MTFIYFSSTTTISITSVFFLHFFFKIKKHFIFVFINKPKSFASFKNHYLKPINASHSHNSLPLSVLLKKTCLHTRMSVHWLTRFGQITYDHASSTIRPNSEECPSPRIYISRRHSDIIFHNKMLEKLSSRSTSYVISYCFNRANIAIILLHGSAEEHNNYCVVNKHKHISRISKKFVYYVITCNEMAAAKGRWKILRNPLFDGFLEFVLIFDDSAPYTTSRRWWAKVCWRGNATLRRILAHRCETNARAYGRLRVGRSSAGFRICSE